MGAISRGSFGLLIALVVALCSVAGGPAWALPALSGTGLWGLDGVVVDPNARAGYQKMFLNFNLPVTVPRIFPNSGTLDLRFQDANMWVGGLSAVAYFPSGVSFILNGQAIIPKNMTVVEPQEMQSAGQVSWTGKNLEWWSLEAALGYPLGGNWSLLLGLRRDHLSVGISNPRDASGNPLNFYYFYSDMYGSETEILTQCSDLMLKLWIPYLGVKMERPGFRFSLLYSPFADAQVRIPAPLNISQYFTQTFGAPFMEVDFEGFDIRYKAAGLTTFLESDFEVTTRVRPNFTLGIWGSLSWLKMRGAGNLTMTLSEKAFADGVQFEASGDHVADSGVATCTRGLIAGGFSAALDF